jgi:ClpP class serine protease
VSEGEESPAASLLKVLERKPIARVGDQTLVQADIAEKALRQVRDTVRRLLAERMPPEQAEKTAEALASGQWTHDYAITVEEARNLGLTVNTELPDEVYRLMGLYPQSAQRRPSVEYIPTPRQRSDSPDTGA